MSSLEIDAQLVVQAQNGDAAARHRILACVAAWLPRAAALRYPYLDERADLCQEVLLQVHLGLDRIQDPACFTAWAYGVLRNCSWARVRAERRDHSVVVEHPELHAAVAEHSLSSTRTPEEPPAPRPARAAARPSPPSIPS
jgi:DNA-directed RNA polymerase specialized sigma24 family protein